MYKNKQFFYGSITVATILGNRKDIFLFFFIIPSFFSTEIVAQYIYGTTKADTLYWEEHFEEAVRVQTDIIKLDTAANAKMFPNYLMYNLVVFCTTVNKIDTSLQLLNELINRKDFELYGLLGEVPLNKLHSDKRWNKIDSIVKDKCKKEFGAENFIYILELQKLEARDQAYRCQMVHLFYRDRKKADVYNELQGKIDEENYQLLDSLAHLYGWPENSKEGPVAVSLAFMILIHADLAVQKRLLPLIEKNASVGEDSWANFALLTDKILVREDKKQLYGTQVKYDEKLKKYVLFPVEDLENLKYRRFEKGLGDVESYLKRF